MRANCDTLSSLRLISWRNVCSLISKSIVSQALHLELTDQVPGIFGSKVGGVPYLPDDAEIPCDAEGNPLQMLAQINCTELSALPEFPQEGLLQFWIGQDESYGLFKDGGARVIYYSETDSSVTEDAVRARLAALPKQKITEISELGDVVGEMLSEEHGGMRA